MLKSRRQEIRSELRNDTWKIKAASIFGSQKEQGTGPALFKSTINYSEVYQIYAIHDDYSM